MVHLNRILLLCCALLLVAMDALAQPGMPPAPSAWQKYKVAGEEFSIALPAVPAMTTYRSSRNIPNQRERTLRYLGVYADGVVYTLFSDDEDLETDNSLDGILPSKGWNHTAEKTLIRDGVTGKQYTSSDSLGGVVQVFVTQKHFYRIQAFGATAADARVQQFFSSLTFGRNEGIEVSDGPGKPFEPVDGSVQIPAENVLLGKPTERKFVIVMRPEPTYTDEARQKKVEGRVVLKTVFSSNGSVVNIQVKEELPGGLTERAVEAAKKIKFIPAAKDGRFVSMWVQLEYNFNLY